MVFPVILYFKEKPPLPAPGLAASAVRPSPDSSCRRTGAEPCRPRDTLPGGRRCRRGVYRGRVPYLPQLLAAGPLRGGPAELDERERSPAHPSESPPRGPARARGAKTPTRRLPFPDPTGPLVDASGRARGLLSPSVPIAGRTGGQRIAGRGAQAAGGRDDAGATPALLSPAKGQPETPPRQIFRARWHKARSTLKGHSVAGYTVMCTAVF